jgi:membrane-bound lytic murein transglycosylase B
VGAAAVAGATIALATTAAAPEVLSARPAGQRNVSALGRAGESVDVEKIKPGLWFTDYSGPIPFADVPDAPASMSDMTGMGEMMPEVDAGPQAPRSFSGGVPSLVLDAYRTATETLNQMAPRCKIPVELLAAIGKVESGHARGGRVDKNGTTVTPILGPVLDGNGFAAIADTDDGVLDGNSTWDRAVGPMQFIPGTWRRWGADGNGDGKLDPHNAYDASLGAARYLCSGNRNLADPADRDAAILSYNRSTAYRNMVVRLMEAYAASL